MALGLNDIEPVQEEASVLAEPSESLVWFLRETSIAEPVRA